MKMKLMLEKGAQFGMDLEVGGMPAELENKFLKQIMEFEKQVADPVITTVFERLNKPSHFKPVNEISVEKIDEAWNELLVYLGQHNIQLDACSPNISNAELYRFTTEELFKMEMNVINIPGMMTCFIYDEFHPDPVYESSRMVEHDLFGDIFRENELFHEIAYDPNGFVFNGREYEDRQEYLTLINRFKSFYELIELDECNITQCIVNEEFSNIQGYYAATAKAGQISTVFSGHFTVRLCINEMGYWNFKKIFIEGFDPR